MGVPCVTMAGSVHAHNVGVSLLSKVGLGNLIAKNEDEYVKLALKLASDISALQNLRMSLRELMSKSPLCDGAKFILGLESTYRQMWRRYCKGDVPALKCMELLQQPVSSNNPSSKNSEPTRATNSSEGSPESVKANGFSSTQPPKLNFLNCEENGGSLNHSSKQGIVGSS
ncbi:Putative UDP-N-acetylglucosamine--peptide N-acetylglucosaminyltransferase SPINDLY [Glycine soja]|nr:Putative UDP-N-acetylglucosamine--peptide N-acetylglucosaminyltransferase SPINDLY [Glycine soja]